MGLRSGLAYMAKTSDVPVFVVVGGGYRSAVHRLRLAGGIKIVASPRHAAVLLIAGSLTEAATESVQHVHDQMAGPRHTVSWGPSEHTVVPVGTHVIGDVADVAIAIRKQFHDVVTGAIPAEPPLLDNVDAVEWRGVGPYGHGGAGMTGGTPYGRPLTLRAPSRDRLELDQLPVVIGPWFAGFPTGLSLRISLQGDVAQAVEVVATNPIAAGSRSIFDQALHEPIPIHDLEMARATHLLEWMADALAIAGVDRLALRADRLASTIVPGDAGSVERLAAATRRSLLRPMTMRTVGVLPDDVDTSNLGPVARAAGVPNDRRTLEQGYRDIDFRVVTRTGGDAWARFEQRAAEAAQAVDLAGRAGDRMAFGNGEVEAPDGLRKAGSPSPADISISMLDALLTGMEWGDLVTAVQSLDIDMEDVSVGNPAV
ncbi:MAG: hypothetical protein BMS9Abin17_1177 [Acidimicrobiia bacterium]|nr:MAG: hypothetical protein BMS9Abin17_1177 [Acidimicrobiia bacterium]